MFGANTSYHQKQVDQAKDEGKRLDEITLVCLTNGSRVTFLDDGPWKPAARPGGDGTLPNTGRARLVDCLKKRDHQGFPLWVSEKPIPAIMDWRLNEKREVPVLDDAARARMAAFKMIHDERMAAGRADMERRLRAEQATATANNEAAVTGALARILKNAGAIDDKPAKPAPIKPRQE